MSDWARVDGAVLGAWRGEHPVDMSRLGTRRLCRDSAVGVSGDNTCSFCFRLDFAS